MLIVSNCYVIVSLWYLFRGIVVFYLFLLLFFMIIVSR